MAVSMETQRLISVSLGKIAQSRGQRGGINLHKNLLVATVLHKARNAFMIESYSYQQNLHRQKQLEQYQLQQQNLPGQKLESSPVAEPNKGETTSPVSRDHQHGTTFLSVDEQTRSDLSSENAATEICANEPTSDVDTEVIVPDKENSPPFGEDQHLPESNSEAKTSLTTHESHLTAAVQLSQDAHMGSCDYNCKHQTVTSGGTTCNVLKRRRDNPSTHEAESPVNKIARVQHDTVTSSYTNLSVVVDSSALDETSRSESQISHTTDSHQILNLVNIFNSGFSGLCVASNSELHVSSYPSDYDVSSSHQLHTRTIAIKAG